MPSPFDDIDADMQADIDALFGEGIRVIPQVGDGNYSSGADPARPQRDGVRATVARAPQTTKADYRGTERSGALVASAPAELWIDRVAYAALGYELARGDFIEITDDANPARYTVAAVNRGDGGDVQVILG